MNVKLVRTLPCFTVLQLITETTTEHFSNKPAKSAVKWNRKSAKSEGVSHPYSIDPILRRYEKWTNEETTTYLNRK